MSTRLLAVMLLALAACATVSPETQIRALEQQQAHAAISRDRGALENIFAPDFRIINPSGAVASKDELLNLLTAGHIAIPVGRLRDANRRCVWQRRGDNGA